MTRRLALAVALAFTTVVTFAMVAIGAQAGFFGDGGKDGAPADAVAGQAPTPEPTVITEYIYVDQTVTPEAGSAPSQGGSDSGSGSSFADSASAPGGDDEHDDEHDDDDHESEHEEDDD